MNDVNVEENKLKRKSIIDNWLKIKNPLVEYQDQRVENFEMVMALCTLTKRQRPLLSKQSVEHILSMLDVVYNGICQNGSKLYHAKAKNGVLISISKLIEVDNLRGDDFLTISSNARTMVIRNTFVHPLRNNADVFNVIDMTNENMPIVREIRTNHALMNNRKISPEGLYLIGNVGDDLCVYDLYHDVQPVTIKISAISARWCYDICDSSEGALVALAVNRCSFKVCLLTFGKTENTEKCIGTCCISELDLIDSYKHEHVSQLAFVQDGKHVIAVSSDLNFVYMFDCASSEIKMKMANYRTSEAIPLAPRTQCAVRGIRIDHVNNRAVILFILIDETNNERTLSYFRSRDTYYAIDITSGKMVVSPKEFERLSYDSCNICVNNNDVAIFTEQHVEYEETATSYRKNYYSFLRVRQTYSQKYIDVIAGYPDFVGRPISVYESFD
jgi:hypothetical protein